MALASIYERLGEFARSRALAERVALARAAVGGRARRHHARQARQPRGRARRRLSRGGRAPRRDRGLPQGARPLSRPSTTSAIGSGSRCARRAFPTARSPSSRACGARTPTCSTRPSRPASRSTRSAAARRRSPSGAPCSSATARARTRACTCGWSRRAARSRRPRSIPRGNCRSENRFPSREFRGSIERSAGHRRRERASSLARRRDPMHTLRHVIQRLHAHPRRPDRERLRRRRADERGARSAASRCSRARRSWACSRSAT